MAKDKASSDSWYKMSGDTTSNGGGEGYTEASKKKSGDKGGMPAPMANC